jgi:hypothetical protein
MVRIGAISREKAPCTAPGLGSTVYKVIGLRINDWFTSIEESILTPVKLMYNSIRQGHVTHSGPKDLTTKGWNSLYVVSFSPVIFQVKPMS